MLSVNGYLFLCSTDIKESHTGLFFWMNYQFKPLKLSTGTLIFLNQALLSWKNNIEYSFWTLHLLCFNDSLENKAACSKDVKNIHICISHYYSQKAQLAKQQHIMRHLCVARSCSSVITSVSSQIPLKSHKLPKSSWKLSAEMSYLLHADGGIWIPLRVCVRMIAISSRAALAAVRQGHSKPLTQLELYTTLWQLYLQQEVVHTAHFNPSGVDSWALLLVCPQPWPACSSPHWLPSAARIPNPSLWQPPWSFFLNKPVHNNWELGRADNYFFSGTKYPRQPLLPKMEGERCQMTYNI